ALRYEPVKRHAQGVARRGNPADSATTAVLFRSAVRQPLLGGLFYVPGRCACIAVRGGGDTRLIAAGATARRRPLGTAPADAGRRGILQLLAHAIELSRVVRAETTAGRSRPLTVTSTTTTHRRVSIPKTPERTFHRPVDEGGLANP